MRNKVLVLFAIMGCTFGAAAFAVTGSSSLTPGSGGGIWGYNQGSFGSMTSPTLSDGKIIRALFEGGSSHQLYLVVKGFTSNPGKSYFNNIFFIKCAFTPNTQSSASAATYSWNATTGEATWMWIRTNACLQPPTSGYTISIN